MADAGGVGVTVFGPQHADVYEATYRGRGKDWEGEAADVARVIRELRPGALSLLDVGCGTGAHLETFHKAFAAVEGVEIAEPMRERARRRLPGVTVHDADMRQLSLGRTFDAVTCLFTAINFLSGVEDMRAAVASMARHLAPGGVLVVEPWWFPETFIDGYVGGDLVRDDGRVVARVSRSVRQGNATRMEERWVVADASGFHTFDEVGFLALFAREDYVAAFEAAGCSVEYRDGWLTGRGLFVGVKR